VTQSTGQIEQAPTSASPMVTSPRTDQVDLVLQRVDSLPTLSPVATRVLSLSGSEETDLRQIIQLVEADPALSARLISLCRRADRSASVTTVDRAVVLLGIDAVRAALLSVQVFELIGPQGEPETQETLKQLDRRQLWLYAIAAGSAAEVFAESLRGGKDSPKPGEAYLCGLLHDLGKIVLDRILPKAFARCVDLAEQQRVDFAVVSRKVIGIDHYTVGKRLGERWHLPHAIQDAMWLHDHPPERLPDLAHKRTLELVIAGVALARSMHLGWSGSFRANADLAETLRACGVPADDLDWYRREVHDRVAHRASTLGLMDDADQSLLLAAVNNANRQLGRLHELAVKHARSARSAGRALEEIGIFQPRALSGGSLVATLGHVARSARSLLGGRPLALLWQHRDGADIEAMMFDENANAVSAHTLSAGETGIELATVSARNATSLRAIAGSACGKLDWATTVIVPMAPGNGAGAALIHRPADAGSIDWDALDALAGVWAVALAAAAQHDGARRLAEDLARANTDLQRQSETMARARTLAHLSEVAAGAAHEMNNPLTVISGQAQLLMKQADSMRERASATAIVEAAHRVSELIRDLHFFASPPSPTRRETSAAEMVSASITEAIRLASERKSPNSKDPSDSTILLDAPVSVGSVNIDPDQIGLAVTEVVLNAIQAEPTGRIQVRVHREPVERRLVISVEDDGVGMSEHTLAHAFDPFFSARLAGRRTGLGLARARRLVELHGGSITMRSEAGVGTEVRISLPTEESARETGMQSAA